MIINGAMQVAQRGTSVAGVNGSVAYNTADRWKINLGAGTFTQSVENDAPTGSGLRNSLKMLCTTADASLGAGVQNWVGQVLEGQNLQQFAKGTASAKQFSWSFWVKSNVTGTYIAELYDADNNRTVSTSYTISDSATWEKKTLSIPADTTGAFNNDNGTSLFAIFWIGAGTDFASGTLNTTWNSAVTANRAVGQTNLAAATDNYWQVTGVQLEAGAVATPFEFEDYSTTLAKCQRYYLRLSGPNAYNLLGTIITGSATVALGVVYFPVTMRIEATALEFSLLGAQDNILAGVNTITALTLASPMVHIGSLTVTSSGMTAHRAGKLLTNNNSAGYIAFYSEL